jgi:hypothetical protein
MLRGEPQQYVDFARNYFERDLAGADVAAVYRHEPLTGNLVRRLYPDADLESLATDLDEIGYPE